MISEKWHIEDGSICNDDNILADIKGSVKDPIVLSRANLMAAAPDLLDACKAIAKDGANRITMEHWLDIVAAIAKSEGK